MRKHSDERSESPQLGETQRYVQRLFLPPERVHITLNVAYDVPTRTARYQVQVEDPSTKELLALWSRPYHTDCTLDDAILAVRTEAGRLCAELEVGEPF